MSPRRFWRSFFSLAVLFAATGAEAQLVVIPRFDFSFSNPGARSLGFGGAFAALADDATAAYANPAGLVQLTEIEVSFETRLWSRSPSFIAGGRLDGEPTGLGVDTRSGPLFERDHSQDLGPSFASVVIPRGRWSFALYGHQLAQFEQSAESQGFFSDEDFFFPFGFYRSPAFRETVDLEAVSLGTAAGFRLNDRLSAGLGLVVSDVSLNTKSDTFFSGLDQYAEVTFRPDDKLYTLTLAMEGTAVTVNAGVLGRISEQLSASLFYRQGAEVDGTATLIFGPSFPLGEPVREEATFKVPNVAGAGLAFRSKDGRVTLAAEADWVEYSGLIQVGEEGENVDYQNTWEYHVGAEYALLQSTPILAFRAGAWVERDEEVFFDDSDVTHLSAGIGIVTSLVQIDLAGDFSERGDTASLSFIYDF